MKLSFHSLFTLGCAVGIMLTGSAFAQSQQSAPSEQWNLHGAQNSQVSQRNTPAYYKTPSLKPAKKNERNTLRRQGWHTHPDPYIEEGGVYTNKTHPALTQHGSTLHQYSSSTPNNYMSPPSTVLSPYRNGSRQQAVKIQDPIPGNVAPIPLPPEKN